MKNSIKILIRCAYVSSLFINGMHLDEKEALKSPDQIQPYSQLYASFITQHVIQQNDPTAIYNVQPKTIIEYFEMKYNVQSCASSPWVIQVNQWYQRDIGTYHALIDQIVTQLYKSNELILDTVALKFQQHANDEKDAIEKKIEEIIPKHAKKKSAYRHCVCKNTILGLIATTGLILITAFSWTISHCNSM